MLGDEGEGKSSRAVIAIDLDALTPSAAAFRTKFPAGG